MLCPKTQVVHECSVGSDHAPLIIFSIWNEIKGKWRFHFENKWLLEESFSQVISDSSGMDRT